MPSLPPPPSTNFSTDCPAGKNFLGHLKKNIVQKNVAEKKILASNWGMKKNSCTEKLPNPHLKYLMVRPLVKINYNLCRVTEMYKLCTANYRTTLFTTFSVSRINIGVREEKNSGTDNSLTDIEGNFPGNLSEGWGETKFSRLNMKT